MCTKHNLIDKNGKLLYIGYLESFESHPFESFCELCELWY